MIYLDIDGVLVDFVGTAKKFGVEMEHNKFGVWQWCDPTPAEFYAVAEPQEWFTELLIELHRSYDFVKFISKDYPKEKLLWLIKYTPAISVIEAPDKSVHCKHPTDLLIDDNPEECERWRNKGGIAYWFNLAEDDPFEKFLKWWRLGK